jgi:RHS repeat-associated protein
MISLIAAALSIALYSIGVKAEEGMKRREVEHLPSALRKPTIKMREKMTCSFGHETLSPCTSTITLATSPAFNCAPQHACTSDTLFYDIENATGHSKIETPSCVKPAIIASCTIVPSSVTVADGDYGSFLVIVRAANTQGSGTVTVSAGSASATASATVLDVFVSPDTAAITRPPHRPFVAKFVVHNNSLATDSYTFSATCTTGDSCGSPSPSSATLLAADSIVVQVSYTTGSVNQSDLVKLTATSTAGSAFSNFGTFAVTVAPAMSVSTAATNQEKQSVVLCASFCATASYATTTSPYISQNGSQNVTLTYNGDRLAVRPFIYADVSVQSGSGLLGYTLAAQVDWTGSGTWTNVQFLNGEQILHFKADTLAQVRLGGQLDASTYASDAYPLRIIVTGQFPNSVIETITDSTHRLLVVNEQKSAVARGWKIGGIPRIYDLPGIATTLVDGDGSATVFRFKSIDGGGTTHYRSPDGDFTDLSWGGVHPGTYVRASADSAKAVFNSIGQLVYVLDRFGHRRDFVYDAQGRLTRVGDAYRTRPDSLPQKTYIALTYNAYGLASIREPGPTGTPSAGRTTTISVGTDSTLTQIQDPDGISTRFAYDSRRRLSNIVNRRGDTTSFTYGADSSWKLATIALPRVSVDSGGSTLQRRPSIVYAPWDTAGVPYVLTAVTAKVPTPVSAIQEYITDPGGHRTRFTVDRWGQPLVMVDPGGTTTITREGIFATVVDHPDSTSDSFSHDGAGLLTASWPAHEHTRTTITYGAYAQPISVNSGTQVITYSRGVSGRVDSLRANGALHKFYYDSLFRDTLEIDPDGHRMRFHYDAGTGNKDSALTMPQSGPGRIALTVWKFDGHGRDSVVSVENGPSITTLYDSVNRPVSVRDGLHPNPVQYKYDGLFRLRVQDAKGQVFRQDVNALGVPTRIYDAADTLNRYASYRYNLDGLLVGRTNRRGTPITIGYDSLHRITSQSDSTSPSIALSYSSPGHVRVIGIGNAITIDSSFLSPASQSVWVDSAVTWLGGKRFRRFYHHNYAHGQIDSVNVSMSGASPIDFASERYFYGSSSSLLDSMWIDTLRTRFHHNADQLRDSTRFAGVTSRVDSLTSQHVVFKSRFTSTALDTAFYRAYIYDSASKLSAEIRKSGGLSEARQFQYDSLDEIKRVQKGTYSVDKTCSKDFGCAFDTTVVPSSVVKYSYDAAENMTSEADSLLGTTNTFVVGTGNHLLGMTAGAVLDSVDVDGNRFYESSVGGSRRFTWSADGLLRKVVAGGRTISYDYDASGQLVRRSINGVIDRYFLWDRGQLLAELNATVTSRIAEYKYLPGVDNPLAVITGGTGAKVYHFLAKDQMGNVLGAFSASTVPDVSYRYDAWGKTEARAGAMADSLERLRWKGLVWEGDSTRLYYARARWYDPATHRFLSEDPLGTAGGLNLFAFANNDAVNGKDPSGTCAFSYTGDVNLSPGTQIRYGGDIWTCACDGSEHWLKEGVKCTPPPHDLGDGGSDAPVFYDPGDDARFYKADQTPSDQLIRQIGERLEPLRTNNSAEVDACFNHLSPVPVGVSTLIADAAERWFNASAESSAIGLSSEAAAADGMVTAYTLAGTAAGYVTGGAFIYGGVTTFGCFTWLR